MSSHVQYLEAKGFFFFTAQQPPSGPGPPHYRVFIVTLRRTTLGRTPLDGWSARCRELYLTPTTLTRDIHATGGIRTHNPKSERPQTHALDRDAKKHGDGNIITKIRTPCSAYRSCVEVHWQRRASFHFQREPTSTHCVMTFCLSLSSCLLMAAF